jgi:hypothetical protein
MRHAPSARADLDHLDHRHEQGKSASAFEAMHVRHLGNRRDAQLGFVREDGFRGCAAHVEREDIVEAILFAPIDARQRATRGTRLDEADREARGGFDVCCAAAGKHHVKRSVQACPRQTRLNALEVIRGDGLHVRIRHGCGGSLIFAHGRRDLMRYGDRSVRHFIARDLVDVEFVARVGKRVEQANRHRLDSLRVQSFAQLSYGVHIERMQYFSACRHPFRDSKPQTTFYQRRRFYQTQIVNVVTSPRCQSPARRGILLWRSAPCARLCVR